MTQHRDHPSRRAWPDMPGPVLVTRQRRRWTVGLLYVGLIVNMLASALIFSYVQVLKHDRNTEQQRIERLVQRNDCDLTDQLPAGPPLDRLRALYHCGPGLTVTPKH